MFPGKWIVALGGLLLSLAAVLQAAEEPAPAKKVDLAEPPSTEHFVGGDKQKQYFLIGPVAKEAPPPDGYSLLVVMPGGTGSADFQPFVKNLFANSLTKDFLVAQPVAVKWEGTDIVWPTAKNKPLRAKFSTEPFIDGVIDDIGKQHKLNQAKIFTLSWSSSGPAAYSIALSSKKVRGSLIAMSVFYPGMLPPLAKAKGQAFYLLHSPDDTVCKFSLAEHASESLAKEGAKVTLVKYQGDHGWNLPTVFADVSAGVEWLEKNSAEK